MHRALIFAVVIAAAATAAGAAETYIVENGRPRAEIVIAEKPARTVRLAADDLRKYIEKISGARLPIVNEPSGEAVKLFVGRSRHTEKLGITSEGLKCGAYRLVSGEDWLAFIGDDADFAPKVPLPKGRSAVADGTLQREWEQFTGEKWGVPDAGAYKHLMKLPAGLGKPDGATTDKNETSELWGFDERGSYNAVCGWLGRLGVRWYLPGELGEVVPELKTIALAKIDETVKPDFDVRRFNFRFGVVSPETARWCMRLGMRDPYGLQVAHGMATMTGRDEIFAARPDWFALYGGKRHYQPGYSKNQLCYSNDELFQHTVRYVRAQFDRYDFDAVSVMPPDGYTAACQCPKCDGKAELGRGSRGSLSNHIWDFVNRVAKEVAKTHPDKLVVNAAYGPYHDPPTNIEKLEPNVLVVIVGGRIPRLSLPEQRAEIRAVREAWLAKTDHPIVNFENYPFTGRGWYLPAFTARSNGASLDETKSKSIGEDIWLSAARDFDVEEIGFNHFQVYFTAANYWGGKRPDSAALLDEYCRLFYGTAAAEMKSFFVFCEDHWQEMETDKAKTDEVLALFTAAKGKVEASTKYGRRIKLIDDFLNGLRRKSALLAQKRGVVPKLRMVGDAHDIVVDGKLDDEYWHKCSVAATGSLRELQTGRAPTYGTTVKAGWAGSSVYFAIRCDEKPGEKLNVAATKREDPAVWYGDVVELLIATDMHSYYQLAVNSAGALVDYDRGADKASWSNWDSQAELKTHVADDHWTVEIRIPVTSDENDPLNQLIGKKPTQSLPWHINICRQRIRENGSEHSAFSPTAVFGFHEPMKFAHFYDGRSHTFDADPTLTDFITELRSAAKSATEKKHAEALATLVALADGSHGKATDLQKSAALKQAAAVARAMKDSVRAAELAAAIPIEAERKNVEMQNLLAERKVKELIERFGNEDFAKWPFWASGEGYHARGRAYTIVGDKAKAVADLKAASALTGEKRTRFDIEEELKKLAP